MSGARAMRSMAWSHRRHSSRRNVSSSWALKCRQMDVPILVFHTVITSWWSAHIGLVLDYAKLQRAG